MSDENERAGRVVKKRYARGSKSEREAVMLVAGGDEYVLRVQGGNPFRDDRLEALVGKSIRARGRLHGNTFIVENWTEMP